MLVKICGVSDPDTALVAAEAGADFIGLVFYPGSHRYVTRERAREIVCEVHSLADGGDSHEDVGVETSPISTSVGRTRPLVVGLFVNEPIDIVIETRDRVGLDIIQLSGDESAGDMERLRTAGLPFIATARAGNGDEDAARRRFETVVEHEAFAVHLDAHVPGMWGGSGVVGDWVLARELASSYRLILAGGLDPGNVGAAIETVRPYAVDVSSGVETAKVKDHSKIRAFIDAATVGRQGA